MNHQFLAAFCLMKSSGAKGKNLFSFVSSEEESKLHKIAESFLKDPTLDFKECVKSLCQEAQLHTSSLEEIHPGWILEKLKDESPRVIGLLCRFLTGDKVRYILDHLPPHERNKIPKVKDAFQSTPALLALVQALIEKKVPVTMPSRSGEVFSLEHLAWFKESDLRILFKDLGLEEIRCAFYEVSPKVLRPFLARFSLSEATQIRNKMDQGGSVSDEKKQKAQKNILSLKLENLSAESLIPEIGCSVFAGALLPEDSSWADIVCQKLPPEDGYRLKRMIQEMETHKSLSEVQVTRNEILTRVRMLGEKRLIKRYWK